MLSQRRQHKAAAILAIVLLGFIGQVKGDFFGTMLTAFAKSVFNPDGPKVDKDGTLGQEAPDNAPVITGNGGIASMAEELAAINEELRQRSGKPLGKYVSNYKDAENMLKSQLAEDAYEMEDDLSKAAASGKVSGSKLTALEQQEYDRLKAKLEGAEELEEEFDTTADMANTIAEDYGQDVEITVEDQAGHEYAVKSDLKHTKFFVPSNSEMQANAQAIAEKMSSGGGYDINAGQESVLQWEAEEADAKAQQMEEDMGDDVEVVYPNVQNPPPPALPVDHQQKQPAQQKQPVQESMAGTMTGESTTAVVPQQLDDEVPDYEELEEAAEEGFTWPEYEKELKWRQEHPEDGKPVERFKGRKVPEPAAGTKLGDGFIEAEDTNITEGIAEGREAEANTLMTWDELQHFERENLHSPRIRFRINVLAIPNSPADGNVNGKSEVVLAEPFSDIYIKSVSGCLVKDIETAAGYYYSESDTWEPGFGVYYNNTLINDGVKGYGIKSDIEVIYPSGYNPEDIERFLQRLMTVPEGIFSYTYGHHSEVVVALDREIEYCSKDWTYWDFKGGPGNWDVFHMSEMQNTKHECWYQPKAHVALIEWDMEDVWLLIGAMLVSGGMAVACVAALTKCCCEPAHISYYPDEEDDDALPIHRRELIAKRLKGKGDASTTLDSVRRKSEKLWRNAQFTPHAEHSDSSKKSPTEKIRELADTFSSPTWYNKSNDLDDKYGKKFNKQGKFTWVADYKSARRLREQIVDSKKSDDLIEHPTRMGDDLPVSSSLSATNASLSEYFGQAAAVPRNPVKDYQLRDDAV